LVERSGASPHQQHRSLQT